MWTLLHGFKDYLSNHFQHVVLHGSTSLALYSFIFMDSLSKINLSVNARLIMLADDICC